MLAFPANNFGGQEPGSNDTIKSFCREKQKATFDLFVKVSVKGDDQCPLFNYLTAQPGLSGDIKWNFEKFLVDRTGKLVARFGTRMLPEDPKIVEKLEAALAAKSG